MSESIRTGSVLRPGCYAGIWQGRDGRLIFEIKDSLPPLVSARSSDGENFLSEKSARFIPAPDPNASIAQRRLDVLEVELGSPGHGTTLRLMFAVKNTDARPGQSMWLHVPEGAPTSAIVMHLEPGPSFLEAVLGKWDDAVEELEAQEGGWLRPYCTYTRAE